MDSTRGGNASVRDSRKRRADSHDAPSRRKRQQPARSLPLESYLVGWIVALEDELTAALAMLDERHDEPEDFEQPQNDTNAYHWGHIGAGLNCHNIVIASLPGIYGTASAATTAKELSISHPHVRFGLLVGIGAGVPRPEHDVRLGDIVVSRPLGTSGGVIQYDLVKAKATGSDLTGHLAPPPAALQKAAMSLASQHALEDSDIPGIIEDVFKKHPKLAKSGQWAYPKTEQDRLSAETYLRSGVEFSLAEDRKDAEGNLIREARETWCPEIHFGAIGSGDTLVKDVAQRETILKRLPAECLCLEMEAAGLMNAFPCLVIRGICDYGDSRKNDRWQKYAALAAAAYAKELLDSMKAREVSTAPKAVTALKTQIEQIQDKTSSLFELAREQHSDIVLDWLCPTDYSIQLNQHLAGHQHGTGQWILGHIAFVDWVSSPGSASLFFPGSPGVGKTTLMSLITDHLLTSLPNPCVLVLYLYCDYRLEDEQTILHFLAVLLKQVGASHRATLDRISKLYVAHHAKKTRPLESQLKKALLEAVESLDGVYIVLDALDECKRHVRMDLVAYIREMQAKGPIKLMVSSRSIPEISRLFRNDPCIPIRGAIADVHSYVLFRTSELSPAVQQTVGLAQRVVERIVDAADGIFLLARLYVDSLLDAVTAQDVEDTLIDFATKADVETGMAYDMAYRAALARVYRNKGRKLQLARAAFAWVTFARRPLSKSELQHALAMENTGITLNLPDVDYVLGFCAGLLISARSGRRNDQFKSVTLVHKTLKEYLVRKQEWYPRVLYNIALTSTKYLSLRFESPKSYDERRFNRRQLDFMDHLGPPDQYTGSEARQWQLLGAGLGEYALRWWLSHIQDAIRARLAHSEANNLQQVARLLFMTGGPFSVRKDWYLFWETPFHVIVRGNLLLFWDDAIASGTDPGETDSAGRTPLSYAAELGRTAMIERLLELPSVEPSHQDEDTGFTALHHAILQNHAGLVRVLAPLVDVDATDREGKTALAYVFKHRYWKVGRQLFPHVDPGAVLKLAVLGRHESIVDFLDHQDYRSRLVRAKDVDWKTLFESAFESGSEGIASHLLNILQSDPDLRNESLKGVYAEFRAQRTYETAISAQVGAPRGLHGLETGLTGSDGMGVGPEYKMHLLKVTHSELAQELVHEPSHYPYRLLLHMKYSALKRSVRDKILPADLKDFRLAVLKSLEEKEPWLGSMPTAEEKGRTVQPRDCGM